MKTLLSNLAMAMATLSFTSAIELDLSQDSSVNEAMAAIAYDMMAYYKGNLTGEIPGVLPGPCVQEDCYYWWMAGGMWGTMIDYYQYTGDSSYQQTVLQGLAFQIGPDKNYNPPNQSTDIGSEDPVFWAMAALDAIEAGVPDLNDGTTPSWLDLAKAVFDDRVSAWDTGSCDGGLRWQIYSFNAGYNIKNAISSGMFFQLAARLAWHTGNTTYATWANTAYDWMADSVLMETVDDTLYIWDNTDANANCTEAQNFVWTYNHGTMMVGAAFMYNHTNGNDTWRDRINTILNSTITLFFPEDYNHDILSEILCEPNANCDSDQSSFKAYTARWMAMTSLLAPFTASSITPKLATSAQAAARQCSGGDNGRMCGREWFSDEWDGSTGVGQQMSALAVIGATRIGSVTLAQTNGTTNTTGARPSSSSSSSSSPSSSAAPKSTNAGSGLVSMLSVHTTALACVVALLAHELL